VEEKANAHYVICLKNMIIKKQMTPSCIPNHRSNAAKEKESKSDADQPRLVGELCAEFGHSYWQSERIEGQERYLFSA
jgi:hypothetical protein